MSIARSTALLSVARLVTIVLNIFALPLYLDWIGEGGYGQIEWIVLIVNYCVLVFDPGFSLSNQNQLGSAHTAGDNDRFGKLFRSHRTMLAGLGVIGIAINVFLPLIYRPDWYINNRDYSLFFLFAGLQLFFYFQSVVYTGVFASKREFGIVAKANVIGSIINAVVSLTGVYFIRHPWAFVLGNVVQGIIVTGILHWNIRKESYAGFSLDFYRDLYAPNFSFAKKYAWNNVGTILGKVDRSVIESVLSAKALGIYGAAARFPAIYGDLMPLNQVYQPELARAYEEGPSVFSKMIYGALLATFAIIATSLFIPSSLAEPLLRALLRAKYSPEMAPIFVAACLDHGLSIYGTMVSVCAFAARKPQMTTPFVLYFGILTCSLAYPVAIHFGIVGIAWSRVGIQLSQFFILEWVIRKYLAPEFPYAKFMRKKILMAVFAAVFWGLGFALTQIPLIAQYPVVALSMAPIITLPYLLVLVRTRTITLPEKISNKIPILRVK